MRLLIALCALGLLAGCAARPASAWQPAQAEAAAWWVEDVAHGLPRDPAELDLIDGNERTATIARWAAGGSGEAWRPPARLEQRRRRWPLLAAAIAEGAIIADGAGGLAEAAGLPPDRRLGVGGLVEDENRDRAFLDAVVLSLGTPDPEVEAVFRREAATARRELDAAPGGADRRR